MLLLYHRFDGTISFGPCFHLLLALLLKAERVLISILKAERLLKMWCLLKAQSVELFGACDVICDALSQHMHRETTFDDILINAYGFFVPSLVLVSCLGICSPALRPDADGIHVGNMPYVLRAISVVSIGGTPSTSTSTASQTPSVGGCRQKYRRF